MTVPTIMISSTARDLPEHRKAAQDACLGLKCHPEMMEHLPALDADAIDISLKMVEDATVYVGIFAHRYGYIPADPRNPDGISITEMEYNRAVALGKPRLIFIVGDVHTPELEKEGGPGAEKLAAFKDRLMTDRVVKFFASAEQLKTHITQALAHWSVQRLTWMPDPLPEPGYLPEDHDLPPGSRVGMPLNVNFVGREDSLVALADTLLHGADDAKTVITPAAVATGSGGIGKTQLAVEFAWRYGRYFQGVHWINLLGVEGDMLDAHLRAEIGQCGAAMGLPNFPEDNLPEQVKMTLDVWRQSPPRLVIFDNAENTEVVQRALGTLAETRVLVLVTSRWGEESDWRTIGVTPRGLDTLTRDQSIDLLRRLAPHLRDIAEPDLDVLAGRLGDFPLALHLAGRYLDQMRRVGLTVAEYVERLDREGLADSSLGEWAERARQTSPTGHDLNVARTFGLSWAKVDDPLAQRLFRACGYLAPNTPIPVDLLLALAEDDREALALAQVQLVQYGLLVPHAEENTLLVIHPLLADFARWLDGQVDAEAQQLAGVADALVTLTESALQTGLHLNFVPLRLHVDVVLPRAETSEIADANSLHNNLGVYLYMIADYTGARRHLEQALATNERIYGPEDLTVSATLSNLGTLLRTLGDMPAARQHLERALAISERVLGADHPDGATLHNNLGDLLRVLGDLPAAYQHHTRALAIRERALGPDHPDVAQSLNNLGVLLHDAGDLPTAHRYHTRALAIRERAYGTEHPDVAQSLNNLGALLKTAGDLLAARHHYEKALVIRERVFGPDHPDVAQSHNNLAKVLYELNDLRAARTHLEQALRIYEMTLPPGHPEIENVRLGLAAVSGD